MSRYEDGSSSGRNPQQVAAYIDHLRQIGQVYLPALATDYGHLNGMVASSADDASALFIWWPGGSNATGDLFTAWQWISDALQNALGNSATNLDAVAGTILHIKNAYVGTDATSADQIDAVRADDEKSDTSKGYKDSYQPVHVTIARSQ